MRVDFAFGADNRIAQAVSTTVKQVGRGVRLIVYCPDPQRADIYDRLLWSVDGTAFIAHDRFDQTDKDGAGDLAVYITNDRTWEKAASALQAGSWLLNLHDHCPPMPNAAQRVLEIVSIDDADRQQARARWRQYQQAGYALHAHQLGGT